MVWEYLGFVAEIRDNLEKGYSLKQAVIRAIDVCIQKDVLTDILVKNRTEVLHMLLTEYDEEKHMKTVFREGVEEGKQIGYSEGEQVGYSKGRQSLLEEMISRKLKKGKTPEQIAEELEVDIEIIREYIKK